MAVHIHSVTREMVYAVTPVDTRGITATSEPINEGVVDDLIKQGASHLNNILTSKGVDVTSLGTVSESAEVVVQHLICVYAALRIVERKGDASRVRDNLRDEWRDGIRDLQRQSFHKLGTAQPATAVLKTNVDTTKQRTRWRDKQW